MGGGKGGADVEYSQSPEQRAVYQALTPLVQRLGGVYGGGPSTTGGISPQFTTSQLMPATGSRLLHGYIPGVSSEGQLANIQYGMETSKIPAIDIMKTALAKKGFDTISQQPATTAGIAGGAPLYNIPHPAEAVSAVSPLVSPALWNPYMQAEERLMDVLQSRGQLGAPSAGLSGAAAAGLGEFYEQAARNIGLQSYQMAQPIWQAQLQREMMPWQMLPGLLGGTYSTGIAQEGTNLMGALSSGLSAGGLGYLAAMSTPYGLPIALTLGAGGFLGGL